MSRKKKKKAQSEAARPSVKIRWLSWYESKRPVLLFGLKFGLLLFAFYGLMARPFFDRALYVYLEANAWLACVVLHLFGQSCQLSDVTIQSPQFSIAIRRGCDAVEPTWLLCAAILSFPAPLFRKLWGILLGIVLLQTLNLIRIVSLFWIGIHLPSFFNSAHLEIWPTIFIITAITLFVGWKGWSPDRIEPNAAT